MLGEPTPNVSVQCGAPTVNVRLKSMISNKKINLEFELYNNYCEHEDRQLYLEKIADSSKKLLEFGFYFLLCVALIILLQDLTES